MNIDFKKEGYRPSPLLRAIQIILLILIVIGVALLATQRFWLPSLVEYILEKETPAMEPTTSVSSEPVPVVRSDEGAKNATYYIDGIPVTLVDGDSVDSATFVSTGYFGNEVFADVNDDGKEDVVFLLTQETGGSGLFFYVVASIQTEDGYTGSQAYFLGDRIAPQTTEYRDGVVLVNYADRALGEPFSTPPSVGKTVRLTFDTETMLFSEVAQ